MKIFTEKSAETKVINSPEYQEYLEYLEEEAMAKNPDDFCFQKPDRSFYSESDLDVFSHKNQFRAEIVILPEDSFSNSYESILAAM